MIINVIISVLIILCLLFCVFSLIFFKKYKYIKCDLEKIMVALKRVRYGDINLRISELKNKNLENIINRLIETIYDREVMIKEYQATLDKKNLSLKKIIEDEKKLQIFKEEFTATLAHDMKVPVIAELNSINYLLEERFGSINNKQIEVLKLMMASNLELKNLIENILEIYKLEQSEIILNKTKNNLNEYIYSVINEMQSIFDSSHSVIANIKDTDDIFLQFDLFQLKRVLKNILQNAALYSPNNSEINIKTQKKDNKISILITNCGSIITKDDLNLIFNKYYTGYSKFKKAGTGLGLYISKQIMTAHKGEIDVVTNQGDYTTFILTLPLS